MTLKEFSRKYDVPYHFVYETSYRVQPISTERMDREYPEKELYNEVLKVIDEKIAKHKANLEKMTALHNKLVC